MSPLPTIPTSFVPRPTAAGRRNIDSNVGGVLGVISYAILVIVFALAIALFFYGRILASNKVAKDAQLAKAEAAIDPATVKSFVQLRDRLTLGQTLLTNHTAFSNFFATFGSLLPATVRFTTLHLSIDATGSASVDGAGVSKSFNALSVASSAFATDGRIKDVIFSKMSINKDGSVSFGFSAKLDPKLIVFSPNAPVSSVPATETASSTTL